MKKIDKIKAYYEPNMGKGLPEHSVLGWESREAQHLRFDAFVSNVCLEGSRLLDVGCGTGNLLEFLEGKSIRTAYTGVDILESMIDLAKGKGLRGDFYRCDIFNAPCFEGKSFDVVYASGIFNLNLGNNDQFLFQALPTLFGLSGEKVVFNLLHCSSPDREALYCYYHPSELVERLMNSFPEHLGRVEIIDGYLANDFTVICHLGK